MKKINQNLPSFVKGVTMISLSEIIQPRFQNISSVIESEVMRISLFLHQCQKVYNRNKVREDDKLIIETVEDFAFIFHNGHVCFHDGTKMAKIAEFSAPIAENAADIAQIYLKAKNLELDI